MENEGKTKIIIIIVKQRRTTTSKQEQRKMSLKVDANGWREFSLIITAIVVVVLVVRNIYIYTHTDRP